MIKPNNLITTVYVGPTLKQDWVNVVFLLGRPFVVHIFRHGH